MRTNIKADGIEVTKQMHERLDWICSRLEKMANAKDPDALHCDFVVSRIGNNEGEGEFRAEIKFFDSSGKTHRAIATGPNPIAALDIAHDSIEQEFFREQRINREKEKIRDSSRRRADLIKKSKEEPTWWSRGVRKNDEDD